MVQLNPISLLRSFRSFVPIVKPPGIRAKQTYDLLFDAEGRYLLMHHKGAAWYYKMNFGFLALFAGATMYNYVQNSQVFFGAEWFGKAYLLTVGWSIFGLWVFSHRHIRQIWLLKGGKEVAIETYTNFGLTYNRHKILPVACLEGNRLFMRQDWNLYQLEYAYQSGWTKINKRRSFFYRPEHIENPKLWQSVRNGYEIEVPDEELGLDRAAKVEADRRRQMLKKKERRDLYR